MAGVLDSHLATLKSNLHATLSVTFLKHLSNNIPRVSLLWSGPAYPLSYLSLHYPLTHSAAVRLSFMQFHSADFSDFAPFVFCCLWLAPITHPQYISLLESFYPSRQCWMPLFCASILLSITLFSFFFPIEVWIF